MGARSRYRWKDNNQHIYEELQGSSRVCWWAFVAVQKFQFKNKRKYLEQLLIRVLRCDTKYKP